MKGYVRAAFKIPEPLGGGGGRDLFDQLAEKRCRIIIFIGAALFTNCRELMQTEILIFDRRYRYPLNAAFL